jgi:hypothetical protein
VSDISPLTIAASGKVRKAESCQTPSRISDMNVSAERGRSPQPKQRSGKSPASQSASATEVNNANKSAHKIAETKRRSSSAEDISPRSTGRKGAAALASSAKKFTEQLVSQAPMSGVEARSSSRDSIIDDR